MKRDSVVNSSVCLIMAVNANMHAITVVNQYFCTVQSLSILASNCDVHGGIYLSRALQSHAGDHVKEMGEYISAVPQYCTVLLRASKYW